MANVQINNEEDTVEIPLAEYEAIKAVAAGIAEQNRLVLDAIKSMTDAVAQLESGIAEAVQAAIAGLVINVNVPEQPAPVVNVQVPQQAAPNVTIQEAADGPKVISLKVKRDKNGAVAGIEGTEG
jgi:hypothetical protein